MKFNVLIIGGGAAGLSCALILGSAVHKNVVPNKKAGIIMHQKASHLNSAMLNNVLGVVPGTSGKQILEEGEVHLKEQYPGIEQIDGEKVKEIVFLNDGFSVVTNKNSYETEIVVIATGYNSPFRIEGLENEVIPHQKAKASKERIQLKNEDHLVKPGMYVAGSLAGWRSQFAIACGSGASVATDILSLWTGEQTKVHDKIL
ncbi:Pyridine nucleotide-disulphide oxidoreductase [Salegentibacter holothuriorum]|uniref:Pyridine nucleotide-disulphide oxidoreductase n=1 Tax=Salegentibacter holothuriorum TaxID=241145 RepID=A0A1T5BPM1_9FLAO|nr:FAD-dependent oxidoreductase [Salegentibacter holothuriorum]SKB49181.1 Pyridine nucleotide-disulphide oxidoreductase [Salegentibacter holothuriorum]